MSNWFLGLIAMGQGRLGDGQSRYEEAIDAFTRMGDVEQAGPMHNLLAAFTTISATHAGVAASPIAFESLSISRSPRFKSQILSCAVPTIRFESPDTALLDPGGRAGCRAEGGREAAIAEALAQRASFLAGLNRARRPRPASAKPANISTRGRIQLSGAASKSRC